MDDAIGAGSSDSGIELEEYVDEKTEERGEVKSDHTATTPETKEENKTSSTPSETTEQTSKPKPKPKTTEAKTEAKTDDDDTEERVSVDAAQAELIAKQLGLPKEIKSIVDKNGELKFIIPMDGKKYLASPSEVLKGFNLNQVGHKRLQQGKDIETRVRQHYESMKDPSKFWELADKLGHDKHEIASALLENYVTEQGMSDEEKEQRAKIQEAEQLKQENEQFRLEKQQHEHQKQVNQQKDKLGGELLEAMKSNGFKPFKPGEDPNDKRTKCTIMANAIGKVMLANQYQKSLTINDAVYLAKQEWQDNLVSGFSDIDDHHILDIIPERIINAIRKADVAKLKGATPANSFGQAIDLQEHRDSNTQATPRRKRSKQGVDDYFSSL